MKKSNESQQPADRFGYGPTDKLPPLVNMSRPGSQIEGAYDKKEQDKSRKANLTPGSENKDVLDFGVMEAPEDGNLSEPSEKGCNDTQRKLLTDHQKINPPKTIQDEEDLDEANE